MKQEFIVAQQVGLGAAGANSDFGVGHAKDFVAFLDVTAQTGTSPTLDVKFQEWDQSSSKWYDITGGAFGQKTGVSNERLTFSSNAFRLRCVQAIGGTATPTFDFTVGASGTP